MRRKYYVEYFSNPTAMKGDIGRKTVLISRGKCPSVLNDFKVISLHVKHARGVPCVKFQSPHCDERGNTEENLFLPQEKCALHY
jgi:hypothetical protein